MCNFLSALVMRDGSLKMHPMIDSHSELVEYFKLPDAKPFIQHFAKVELTPDYTSNDTVLDVSTWKFRLDEESEPQWWADVSERVERDLRARAERMILRSGDHGLIVDGCWIVGGDAKIRELRSGRIVRLCGGTVSAISGGTVSEIWGGTVSAISGGTVSAIRGGTVSAIWGGTVSAIWGGTVSEIRGGTVSAIWGGTVSAIRGGTVSAIRGGTVSEIRGGTVSAIMGGTVSAIRHSDCYTLTLSEQARAELVRRGVLKGGR